MTSGEITGIVIGSITAIGVFVGPIVANWLRTKKDERNRKLRAHFEELKREAEDLISLASSLQEKDVRIVVADTSAAELGISYIEIRGMRQISNSLDAHFSREMGGWREWEQKAVEHNANSENFRQKIKVAFESKGIPVERDSQSKPSTCIYESALDVLFNRWKEIARNSSPWPDFQNINSRPVEGGYLLYASGWEASAVAFAKTKDEQEKCKFVLAEIAGYMENQREVARMIDSASKLVKDAKCFADQFDSELSDIDKFWPGKETNKFKTLKKTCPACKELF